MPCFNNFCCGYGLRSGGSFIGYFSITVYIKLSVISLIFLLNIKNRIDESEGNTEWNFINQLSNFFRVKSSNYENESSVEELKSESEDLAEHKDNLELFSVYSVVLIVYLLFLVFGVLCASYLITGAKLVSY